MRELIGDTLRTLGVRAHQKGLELVSRVAPEVPPLVVGDAARLRQVIVNLVGNAIKFTGAGEVLVEVEAKRRSAGRATLAFAVSDTGIGIPPEKQALIFEAFAQADGSTTREYGGTGLGLAIASRIVATMGGRARGRERAGQGQPLPLRGALRGGAGQAGARSARHAHPRRARAGGGRQRDQPAHPRGDARAVAHAPDARGRRPRGAGAAGARRRARPAVPAGAARLEHAGDGRLRARRADAPPPSSRPHPRC